jgi:uncharacterized membrane protein
VTEPEGDPGKEPQPGAVEPHQGDAPSVEPEDDHEHEHEYEVLPPDVQDAAEAAYLAWSYSGPIPLPRVAHGWDEVLPGAADRILSMAEREQGHRHDMDRRSLGLFGRGQIFGFVMAMSALLTGGYSSPSISKASGSRRFSRLLQCSSGCLFTVAPQATVSLARSPRLASPTKTRIASPTSFSRAA